MAASAVITSLTQHWTLIWRLAQRDIEARYAGSFLGLIWPLVNALAMLILYTFMFGLVFKARWGIGFDQSLVDFALVLFAGLIAFNFFADVVARAPGLVIENEVYVKKVVFPLTILPWVAVIHAGFNAMIALSVLLVAVLASKSGLSFSVLAVPVIAVPLVLFSLSLAWVLAALGVFVRDLKHVVSLGLNALMFLSPLFYPLEVLPEGLRAWIAWNPMTMIVHALREAIIYGQWPDLGAVAVLTLFAWIFAALALAAFERAKKGFADVL